MEKLIDTIMCVDPHGRTSAVYVFQDFTDAVPGASVEPIKGTKRATLLNGQPLKIISTRRFETAGGMQLVRALQEKPIKRVPTR